MPGKPRTLFEKIWDDHAWRPTPARRQSSRSTYTSSTRSRARRRSPVFETVAPRFESPARPWPPRTTRSRRPIRRSPWPTSWRQAAGPDRGELPRVRDPVPRQRLPDARHRPRHRAGARAHTARHDHRLRRLPHRHARRLRRARVRHRDERDRDGPGHADAAPAQAEDLQGRSDGPAPAGRRRQGHHPRPDRPHRHRRRDRPRLRVHRRRDPRPLDGSADDALQHVDRGRRPSRAGRPGRDHVRLPQGPPVRARRARPGTKRSTPGGSSRPTQAPPTTGRSSSTATHSSRWSPTARTRAWGCR